MPPTTAPCLTIAHRGARSIAPENTLAAARAGHAARAHLWETDVAVTADGELILFHDDALTRTTDAAQRFPDRSPWTFTHFTLAEIRSLDAGTWFVEQDPFGQINAGAITPQQAQNFRGEPIPTVREALQLTKNLDWRINLELKRLPAPHNDFPIVETLLTLIDEVGIPLERVILSSFRHEWLSQAQRLKPEIEVQALVGYWEDEEIDWTTPAFSTYNVRYTLITPAQIRDLSARGLKINLFTINDPADWQRFIAAGVHGIFTDFPQLLIDQPAF